MIYFVQRTRENCAVSLLPSLLLIVRSLFVCHALLLIQLGFLSQVSTPNLVWIIILPQNIYNNYWVMFSYWYYKTGNKVLHLSWPHLSQSQFQCSLCRSIWDWNQNERVHKTKSISKSFKHSLVSKQLHLLLLGDQILSKVQEERCFIFPNQTSSNLKIFLVCHSWVKIIVFFKNQ